MPIKTSKKNSSTKELPDYMIRNPSLLIADPFKKTYFERGSKAIEDPIY